jgi:type III restriction enzyme
MKDRFLTLQILNSPNEQPAKHWELDVDGQPTQQFLEYRREAEFITPIPKPRKRKRSTKKMDIKKRGKRNLFHIQNLRRGEVYEKK